MGGRTCSSDFILSYFSMCRAIPLAKRLTNRVLDYIVTPPKLSQIKTGV